MRDQQFKAKLKLVVPEWGMYKEGDIETFYFFLLRPDVGIIRHDIGDQWEVVEWNQFIGLYDVNKEMIHENDRLSFTTVKSFDSTGGVDYTGTIRWDEEDTGFFIENDDDHFPHVKLWFATNIKIIKSEKWKN